MAGKKKLSIDGIIDDLISNDYRHVPVNLNEGWGADVVNPESEFGERIQTEGRGDERPAA